MSNVVGLTTKKKMKNKPDDKAQTFISEFYDWAVKNGIDTTTTEFKWDAATVLTIVRGLLHKKGM